jgi:CheY-like chemotaxis protein
MESLATVFQGWKVAVIDDEPDSLEIVSTLLEMHGATVSVASNGKDGLELIRTLRPDLIISDLSMPGLTGWELVEALKHGERVLADIPVIALTAHAMEHDRHRAIAAGFHNFITKPLKPETFVKEILVLLAVDRPELAAYLNESS